MKRFYTIVALALIANAGNAQLSDFEDQMLPGANTYWDGADSTGNWQSYNLQMENTYLGYFAGGFAYSNSYDNTTPGFTNQYAVFAGDDVDGGGIFAIGKSGAGIMLYSAGTMNLTSVMVCNTTYAGISMRDGDLYGKKFGSPNNAAGVPDGTNGADWFKITAVGYGLVGDTVGMVDFYLADFRDADSNNHYIIDDWTPFDLTPIGFAYRVSFHLTSSDNDPMWGMNTPNYFAIDHVEGNIVGIEDIEALKVNMYPNPAINSVNIVLESAGVAGYKVIDMTGRVIAKGSINNGSVNITTSGFAAGSYVVETNQNTKVSRQVLVVE